MIVSFKFFFCIFFFRPVFIISRPPPIISYRRNANLKIMKYINFLLLFSGLSSEQQQMKNTRCYPSQIATNFSEDKIRNRTFFKIFLVCVLYHIIFYIEKSKNKKELAKKTNKNNHFFLLCQFVCLCNFFLFDAIFLMWSTI